MSGDSRWLRRYRVAPAASSRLVCFPHAGGSASYFRPLARALADEIDVVAVQYPGRSYRRAEPHFGTIGALADAVADELGGVGGRPATLFGHSMGALVAFEVARRLEARGHVHLSLLVSGRRAPSVRRKRTMRVETPGDVIAELTRLGGTDRTLIEDDAFVARTLLPVLRADYDAVASYEVGTSGRAEALAAPILAYVGDDDPEVAREDAAAWQRHTTGEFELRTYQGNHFYPIGEGSEVLTVIHAAVARCPVNG